ncbi:MAG: NAD(P)/FAD-dependent oxidoreductase [Chloroflexota bacterium]|nr:NAD(P)/FAD-dependent oxidoreductase [Chloroflexota bacterium]
MDRYDVVIVGGGPAGLSAALTLARARRHVLLLDGDKPRNGPSHAAHNFFTCDGEHPMELRRIGREQLSAYSTVRISAGEIVGVEGRDGAFRLRFVDGTEIEARKVILATGVRDILPKIEGVQRLLGTSMFACPYCDGWEFRDQPWAVLAAPPEALMYAAMLTNWTRDLVLLTNCVVDLDAETAQGLDRLGVLIRTEPIARLVSDEGDHLRRIVFATGDTLERSVLFHRPRQEPRSALAEQLGCELVESPIPGLIRVDAMQQTSVPGVFAAGDVTTPMQQIAIAVSTGSAAGAMINHHLVEEMLAAPVRAVER